MPDLRLTTPPPRNELLRELRAELLATQPGLRIVAQELLGAQSPIDFVGVEAGGRLALVVVGEDDRDLELLARGLAQRAWVGPRIRDWLQLAPDLGIQPRAGIRLLLLSPRFRAETEGAAAAVGGDAPELWQYRCLRNGSSIAVLIEPASAGAAAAPPRPADPAEPAPAARPAPTSAFRTGLTEADLGLTPSERREFE